MTDDPRCCGSGSCIIDPEGRCWCGQQWVIRPADQPPVEADDSGEAQAKRIDAIRGKE